jgi:hypothetical protein
MRSALYLAILAAFALLAAGCGGANLEKAIIGKYTIDVDSSAMKEEDKAAFKMAESLIKGITMEFKEGGKVELKAMGQTNNGTWKLDGTKLSVTDDKGKTEVMEVQDGGKTIQPDPKSMGGDTFKGAKLSFKKSE